MSKNGKKKRKKKKHIIHGDYYKEYGPEQDILTIVTLAESLASAITMSGDDSPTGVRLFNA